MVLKLVSARRLRTIFLPSLFLGFALFLLSFHGQGDPNGWYTWGSIVPERGIQLVDSHPEPGAKQGSSQEIKNEGTRARDGEGGERRVMEVGVAGAGNGKLRGGADEPGERGTEQTKQSGQSGQPKEGSFAPTGGNAASSDPASTDPASSDPASSDPSSGAETTGKASDSIKEEGSGASEETEGNPPRGDKDAPLTTDASAATEPTVEKSEENPADEPAEKPAEEPAEKRAEKAAEEPAQGSAEKLAEGSETGSSADTSAEKSTETSAEKPSETSAEKPAETSAEMSPDKSQSASQAHAPAPAPHPAEAPSPKPATPHGKDGASGATDSPRTEIKPEATSADSTAKQRSGADGAAASTSDSGPKELRTIIAVTATYPRATQEMYFTRLVSTLRLVPQPLVWIVVEAPTKTEETAAVLNNTANLCLPLGQETCRRVPYIHIETGKADKARYNAGVASRNAALDYIEKNRIEGIVYIMDDDNTYFPQLFDEVRQVKYLGHWPVALMRAVEWTRNKPGWPSKPVVERALAKRSADGQWQVFGWETTYYYLPRKNNVNIRKFNMDMASFAFRSDLLWKDPDPKTGYPKKPLRLMPTRMGFLENEFMKRFQEEPDTIEVLANGCTDVWVFHVHIEANQSFHYPRGWYLEQPEPEDLVELEDDRGQLLVGMEKYSWPYVVNGTRHGLKGKTLPPIIVA